MKNLLFLLIVSLFSVHITAQIEAPSEEKGLPNYLTESELRAISEGQVNTTSARGIETPPPFDNLRNMAEWEEIQALTVAWTAFPSILKQIIHAAKDECEVVVLADNPFEVEFYLMGDNAGGEPFENMDNISVIQADYNSIWMRDYAANAVYGNEVDDLILVDWIYNRPTSLAEEEEVDDIKFWEATPCDDYVGLDDMVSRKSTSMSDGFGTAFASDLILDENDTGNPNGASVKTQEEIEGLLNEWLGTDNYIIMPKLPFDLIHHIDMHMKLLDEETILVGDFGDVSDGPQIQANIEFVLDNTTTKWGTPWKVKWIPMVPTTQGNWPNGSFNGPAYRTFTNSIFINKTILYPSYREAYDTIAQRIYEEELPGYRIIPIDCDDNPDPIIFSAGALHCITHSVGVEDPLLISHDPLEDTDNVTDDYIVEAYLNHRSGITEANMFWRLEGETDYTSVPMNSIGGNDWQADIPAQPAGTTVEYYIHGEATSGKEQNRPMPAPEGYWSFDVVGTLVNIPNNAQAQFSEVYPNPASATTVIPVVFKQAANGSVDILNAQGKVVLNVFSGEIPQGEKKFFFDASQLAAGIYTVNVTHPSGVLTQKLVVE